MKETTIKIICDTCNKDISPHYSGYEAEYILHVNSINIAKHESGQAIYSMLCYPPIDNDLYFCDTKCMTNYNPKKESK